MLRFYFAIAKIIFGMKFLKVSQGFHGLTNLQELPELNLFSILVFFTDNNFLLVRH